MASCLVPMGLFYTGSVRTGQAWKPRPPMQGTPPRYCTAQMLRLGRNRCPHTPGQALGRRITTRADPCQDMQPRDRNVDLRPFRMAVGQDEVALVLLPGG